jgi:hypothetical protein
MGHPPKLTHHQIKEAIRRRDKGEEVVAFVKFFSDESHADQFLNGTST